MKIYLLRHGSAVSVGEQGVCTDEERMLTKEGRECTATVLRRLRKVCKLQQIWTSPLVRARETAEIASEILEPHVQVSTLEHLRAGADPARILRWLKTCTDDSIMLVGHMPDLAMLGSLLTLQVEAEGMALKKSGICCIEFEGQIKEGNGRLMWLVSPSFLSKIEDH
ncbi:MAG: phosphohistidine phosphatase SixA [bacterium]|jgi:phosphohistidine phosphatase